MKCMDKHEFEQQNVFGTGAANTAYAKFFCLPGAKERPLFFGKTPLSAK